MKNDLRLIVSAWLVASVAACGGGSTTTRDDSPVAATVTLLAGSATSTLAAEDGVGAAAVFRGGGQWAVAADGSMVGADGGRLRRVGTDGAVTTLWADSPEWTGVGLDAGGNVVGSGGAMFTSDRAAAYWGAARLTLVGGGLQSTALIHDDGTAVSLTQAGGGLAIDSQANLYLAFGATARIAKVHPDGRTAFLAGNGEIGNRDGVGAQASFSLTGISALGIDAADNLYVCSSADRVRRIAPDGTVSTVARGLAGLTGAIAADPQGTVYAAAVRSVYRITPDGTVSTLPLTTIGDPITGLVWDKSGHLYVATQGQGAQIFKVTF